jgi:PAS domain S-box-containing protein
LRQYQDQLTEILGDSGTNPFPQPVKDTLKLDEGRLKLLADATFEGICVHDHGVILDVNQQFADLLGYTADELKGMDCFGLVAPQFRDAVRNYISSGTQGPYESLGLRKDGSTFPVEVRVREFQLDGKVLRFAVFRDRTEQEEMCRQVIESSKWYRELYEHSPLALYRTRICTERYVDINDRTEFLEKLQRNGRVDGFQVQNIRKDGELIWIECRARFFPERGFIEGAMWDITIAKLLTKTEKKLLRLIMQGKSNKRIGFELERSIRTVEDHRANIMQKLGVDNIVELTQKATDFFAHDSWE